MYPTAPGLSHGCRNEVDGHIVSTLKKKKQKKVDTCVHLVMVQDSNPVNGITHSRQVFPTGKIISHRHALKPIF